jgi:hypothetical protein
MGSKELPRPAAGVRNRGLWLVLTALALVVALVDGPDERAGGGRRPPGLFQFLPPPIGVAQAPPPLVAPAEPAGTDEPRFRRTARRHPRRTQARPAASRPAAARPPGLAP